MARHSPDARLAVRSAYVYEGLNVPGAARKLAIPVGTARNFKARAKREGDDWDKARAAHHQAREGLAKFTGQALEDFHAAYTETMRRLREDREMKTGERVQSIASLADAFTKITKAAGAQHPEIAALGIAMDVLKDLGAFIRNRYPHHAAAFDEILEPFGAELAKAYG